MILECDICNAIVKAEIIASFASHNEYDPMDAIQYTLCKCPQCSSPILANQELDYIAGAMDWGQPVKIYPNNQFHINPVIPEKT